MKILQSSQRRATYFVDILEKKAKQKDFNFRFSSYISLLGDELNDCKTVLDLGCGPNSPMIQFHWDYSVGVEGNPGSAERAKKNRTHSEVLNINLLDIEKFFPAHHFDAVVALDVIEHLDKNHGKLLIDLAERMAKKIIIFATPNGFLSQYDENNNLQEHISGWAVEEMVDFGFEVKGLFGPKFLRSEYHLPRFRPTSACSFLCRAMDSLFSRKYPKFAAGLLCIKRPKEE